ncbi:hypothetical protein FPV67DRAFT_247135 [Lyophyllum atratum]|nr:hypothetical protein FPV67DRAFT_247135 [Lyophyllum atratum]
MFSASAGKDAGAFSLERPHAGTTSKTRKSTSCCKRFLIFGGILTLLASALGIAYGVIRVATVLTTPHRALYHVGPLDEKSDISQVVRPLIGREQEFDIAVTVWVRSEDEEAKRSEHGVKASIWTVEAPSVIPLYSDIVFHGLRLTDKNVFATVNFTLPTAHFRNHSLTNYDLRGSIVLIPSSPSLLDHIVDFSTWLPDFVEALPVRSWPFPLGSPDKGEKTVADEAVESFGVTVPLIQFGHINSRCDNEDGEEDPEEQDGEDPPILENSTERGSLLETTEGKAVLESHPYIVTRTQIRVVDETTPFDRKLYSKRLGQLRRTSCAQLSKFRPTIFDCDRSYVEVGHAETQMTIAVPNESSKASWAYSPYISLSKSAVGPKDLIPIPVNREECPLVDDVISSSRDDEASIKVSWKLSFSGRSFRKLIAAEMVEANIAPSSDGLTRSEHYQALEQDAAELTLGLGGHRHGENAHPRRRLFIIGLQTVLACAVLLLDSLYWFTRTSTVAITIPGTLLRVGSMAVENVSPTISVALLENITALDWISTVLWKTPMLIPELLMIKGVFHLKIRKRAGAWWTRWIPVVYRTPATHEERASRRLDAQTSSWVKGCVLTSLFATFYFLAPHNYAVLPPLLPEPSPNDYAQSLIMDAWPYVTWPMDLAGKLFQITLNWRSQQFAGSYRLSALILLALRAVGFLDYVPMLVGKYDARPVLVAHAFVDFVLLAVLAWQAVTLPRVEQNEDSLHGE